MRRPNKYGAIKTAVDGIAFDSKREALVYQQLKIRQRIGEIKELTPHPSWPLVVNGHIIGKYTADASYKDAFGALKVIDVKSTATARTEAFRLRRKLMQACHGIEVEVVL